MTSSDMIKEIKTQVVSNSIINNFADLKEKITCAFEKTGRDSFWLIYNQNEVLLGKGSIPDESISLEILKEIRIFSENGEMHLWKYDGEFRFRLRIDNTGDKTEKVYIEEHYRLDTEYEVKCSSENRAVRTSGIKLAGELKGKPVPEKFRVYNYYNSGEDKNESGCIKFYDARLVEFVNEGEKTDG